MEPRKLDKWDWCVIVGLIVLCALMGDAAGAMRGEAEIGALVGALPGASLAGAYFADMTRRQ